MLASPEMRETPVRNRLAQYAGNALSAVDQFARAPFGYQNPPAALLSDALGVPAVASTLNRLAYGDRLTQGRGQTLQIRPEVVDAALAVAPIAAKFPKATLGAAGMLAGAADTGAGRAMFIGAKAKTWDAAAAAKAAQMEAEGKDARAIWQETGTFKGADGKWRQEIDDSTARMNLGALPRYRGTDAQAGKIGDVLRHKGLAAAYPDAMQIDLSAAPASRTSATYMSGGNVIPENIELLRPTRQSMLEEFPDAREVAQEAFTDPWMLANFGGDQSKVDAFANKQLLELGRKEAYIKQGYMPDRGAKSDVLHELQHGVQNREGFAAGGSASMFNIDPDEINTARNIAARIARGDSPGDAARWVKEKLGKDWTPRIMDLAMSKNIASMPSSPAEAYRRLAGEAEARATEARMNMSAAERRAKFPYDSYDVPINSLIVR